MILSSNQEDGALGIGLAYNPSLREYVHWRPSEFDFIEIIPDMFWTTFRQNSTTIFQEIPADIGLLMKLRESKPLVAHYIGVSIGTASVLDENYVTQMSSWQKRFQFSWCSDHLSYSAVASHLGHHHAIGVAAPIPWDFEICDSITEKARYIQDRICVPFLLENSPFYITVPSPEMTEIEFINRLTDRARCGLLLDVHNLYVNGRNHKIDCFEYIDRLDEGSVGEVHVAGGSELGGVYTDSHAGPCPDEVWELLDFALLRHKSVRGVTFEFHDSYFSIMGSDGVTEQLRRARTIWERRR